MKIRIGTRKSKLALIQSELAANAIKRAFPDVETELVHITTKGDVILDKPLEKIGGKGVFIDAFHNTPDVARKDGADLRERVRRDRLVLHEFAYHAGTEARQFHQVGF